MPLHILIRWLLLRDWLLGSAYLEAVRQDNAELALEIEREMVRPPFPE